LKNVSILAGLLFEATSYSSEYRTIGQNS
jgi:hypothetical protein